MTGQNKTEQEKHDDAEVLFFGSCPSPQDALEFIHFKVEMDGWRILADPFPLEFTSVGVVDRNAPLINGKTQLKSVQIPVSWGFVLHRFF